MRGRPHLTVVVAAGLVTGAVVGAASLAAPHVAPAPPAGSTAVGAAPAPAPATAGEARGSSTPEAPAFIAFARDFEGFERWERVAVEGAMLPVGTEPGPTYVYRNRAPPEGAREWPVGTIFVKVVETAPSRERWVLHAMVKRGVPYNRDGLVGWEFFELRLSAEGTPSVVWRGAGPPSGHGYAARGTDAGAGDIPLVCYDCHAPAWQDDGVLTPAFGL